MATAGFDLRHLFLKYRQGIVRICVEITDGDNKGDKSIGTGFHIGDGLIVTARHIAAQKIDSIKREPDGSMVGLAKTFFPKDEKIDLAVLESNFQDLPSANPKQKRVCSLPLGHYMDDWLGDDFVLSKVLVMGFPPIPLAKSPFLVSTEAEINAMIRTTDRPHPFFIVSSMARGGFSGGPIISVAGFVLGVVSEALTRSDAETGFFAAISVEPLFRLLVENDLGKTSCVNGDVWRLIKNTPTERR